MKRSELKRSTPLRASKPLRRRAAVKAVSDKRKAVQQERRDFVARILRERPWCEACDVVNTARLAVGVTWNQRRSTDVHELVRRSQGSPIVPSQGLRDDDVFALCRPCHDFITVNPATAVALGLARWGMRTNAGSGREGASSPGTGS